VIKVAEIRNTCSACPSQWEGRTVDGQVIYIRSRWDILSIHVGETLDKAILGQPIAEIVDHAGGWLEYEDLRALTKHVLDLPETGAE
jgi:hypothetical protein